MGGTVAKRRPRNKEKRGPKFVYGAAQPKNQFKAAGFTVLDIAGGFTGHTIAAK